MKLHFLKTTMVLMVCLVFGFAAQAQRGGKMTAEKFDTHIQKLTEQLDLTKRQVRKVVKIEEEFFANMNAVRGEFKQQNRSQSAKPGKPSDVREKPARAPRNPEQAEQNKERRQKMRMVNNNHNNALKKVLTEEQFKKYGAAKEARKDQMRNKVKRAKGQEKVKGKDGAAKMKKGNGAAKKAQPKSQLKVNEGLKKDY